MVEIEGTLVYLRQCALMFVSRLRLGQREIALQVAGEIRRHEAQRQVGAIVVPPPRVDDAVRAALPLDHGIAPEAHRARLAVGGDRAASRDGPVPTTVTRQALD